MWLYIATANNGKVNGMKTNGTFSEATIKVLLEGIEQELATIEERKKVLLTAKRELQQQVAPVSVGAPPSGRLPKGKPRQLIEEIFPKMGRATMGQLRHQIKTETGIDVKDGSARRILDKFIESGKVQKDENAVYIWLG